MRKIFRFSISKKGLSPKELYFEQVKHEIRLLEKQEIEMKQRISLLEKQLSEMKDEKTSDVDKIKQKLIYTAKKAVIEHKKKLDSQYFDHKISKAASSQ